MRASRVLLLSAALLLVTGSAASYLLLKTGSEAEGFIPFAEMKAGEFLNARVHIGRVKLGFFNQIILNDLRLELSPEKTPYRFTSDEIIFRYEFWQLLTRNLNAPASIILKSPKVTLSEAGFPYDFFRALPMGNKPAAIASLEFADGEFHYPVPGIKQAVVLKEVWGNVFAAGDDKLNLDLHAILDGPVSGKLRIRGSISPKGRTHRFEISFESMHAHERMIFFSDAIEGKIIWENDSLALDELKIRFQGWDGRLSGKITNYLTDPAFDLNYEMGKTITPVSLRLRGDFKNQTIQGSLLMPGQRPEKLSGKMFYSSPSVFFGALEFGSGFSGSGEINMRSGESFFDFEKGKQRIVLEANFTTSRASGSFRLEHAKIYGLDVVTQMAVRLNPERTETGNWKLACDYESDFFILEYEPLDGLRGHFALNGSGLQDLSSTWGKVFELNGEVMLKKARPEFNMTLKVDGLALAGVKEFASKPMPTQLSGSLEGKLKLIGAVHNPEISGRFVIKDGSIGKLDFDRAIVQFHGFPPYLPLFESKILKGRTTFILDGALDMGLENMFHGVEIRSEDKVVLWKGWEMNYAKGKSDIEIDSLLSRFPSLTIKGGHEALIADKDNQAKDNYVEIGPKFKF